MSIIIGADFVPTETNINDFISGNVENLFGNELLEVLNNADYRIFNLETPLSDTETPIQKYGQNLLAPIGAITGYKAINVNLLTLANNHILDQGEQGLQSTCEILDALDISRVGAGKTLQDASKPFIFEHHGKKIGVYACAEHEFSIVSEHHAGANPFDPLESPDHIASLKKQCDYVIVLYHGGKEYYRYPSPLLQKVCRKMVEKGANLVICQHSHCVGCEEKYLDGTIVYGQGNFLFDASDGEDWQTSLLILLDDKFQLTYIPIVKEDACVRFATPEKAQKILGGFKNRSAEIANGSFVVENYAKFADDKIEEYLFALSGKHSIWFRAINRLSGRRLAKQYVNRHFGNKEKKILCNYIECEAWREIILNGLKE